MIGYFALIFFSLPLGALVPLEEVLLSGSQDNLQENPLKLVFVDRYDSSKIEETKKVKLYHQLYQHGLHLEESCTYLGTTRYSSSWKEKLVKRSTVATLQYIGLKNLAPAIGVYAHDLEMSAEEFQRLTSNLIDRYCSHNTTVISLKKLRSLLNANFTSPQWKKVPSVKDSPYATQKFKTLSESSRARSLELDYALKSFRSLCSWGGDDEDYRLLAAYLRNPFIMAYIIHSMAGFKGEYQHGRQKAQVVESSQTDRVICENLICRPRSPLEFKESFPLSIGSTGILTDLSKLYCQHFRYQDYPTSTTLPQVKKWIQEMELEDPIFETNYFISLLTGIPDPLWGVEEYKELPHLVKTSIDERWQSWAMDVLGIFSQNILFEESLRVRTVPLRDRAIMRTKGFELQFEVTLGEMDRLLHLKDKIDVSFELKISKNYLRHLLVKWRHLEDDINLVGQKRFKEEMAHYIGLQLKDKEKLFLQKMWNEDLARMVAQELFGQVQHYRGNLFEDHHEKMLTIPIKFHFGLFALGYLKYRAQNNKYLSPPFIQTNSTEQTQSARTPSEL